MRSKPLQQLFPESPFGPAGSKKTSKLRPANEAAQTEGRLKAALLENSSTRRRHSARPSLPSAAAQIVKHQ
jgi:hypothetical protein